MDGLWVSCGRDVIACGYDVGALLEIMVVVWGSRRCGVIERHQVDNDIDTERSIHS